MTLLLKKESEEENKRTLTNEKLSSSEKNLSNQIKEVFKDLKITKGDVVAAKNRRNQARYQEGDIKDKLIAIRVWFDGFGDSSLDFSLLVWCRMRRLAPVSGLLSDYYFALFRKFKEAGIEIPFPQRDLHLRSISPEISDSFKK